MINFKSAFQVSFFLVVWITASIPANSQELIFINEDLQLQRLSEDLYVHISWFELETYGRFSSNGMVYLQQGKALIVDSPMETGLLEPLTRFIEDSLGAQVAVAVPGHFHDDCLNGLPYFHSKGAVSISGKKTQDICRENDLVVPQRSFRRKKQLKFGDSKVVLRYFGGGHAPDNIVVWFPEEQVLFGGCMIRALEAGGLGNTGDAIMEEWGPTVVKIQKAFPAVKTVIPGHGLIGDRKLLQHTIDLIRENE